MCLNNGIFIVLDIASYPFGYRMIVRLAVKDDLLVNLGFTNQEVCTVSPWVLGLKCLNNVEVSFTWLVLKGGFWVSKKHYTVRQAILPKCMCCNFFCVPIVWADWSQMVHVLDGKFFVIEASSVCANVVLSLKMDLHYILLYLLSIMWIVVCTTR